MLYFYFDLEKIYHLVELLDNYFIYLYIYNLVSLEHTFSYAASYAISIGNKSVLKHSTFSLWYCIRLNDLITSLFKSGNYREAY